MTRLNVLYIHSHDTGRHVQPYGHAMHTPNMQRLAEQGMLFRQAFCCGPTCSPSRAAMLTGQSAHNSGMLGLAHRGFRLADPSQHLASTLGRAGYATALIGFQHEGTDPAALGYQHAWMDSAEARAVGSEAARFLRARPAEPFFLSVGVSQTHRDFPSPEPPDDPRYTVPPAYLPDTPQTREDMAGFHTLARQMDEGYGKVLVALDEAGLADRTLVICTTDHGIAFPRMKCNLTDGGIGVLLILRGPGGFNGGNVCDAMVSQLDLFPTICELTGIEPPAWLQGKSIMPVVRGERDQINEEVFAEVTYHAAYEPQRCVRTRRWKYIRRFDTRMLPVLPNTDDGPSRDLWLAHGWATGEHAPEQLYDLMFDPGEANNLVGDPACRDTLADLRGRLDRWMRRTDDPLLAGPVPAPEGAVLSLQEDFSYRDVIRRREGKP